MKICRAVVFSLLFIAILTLPMIEVNPTATAVATGSKEILPSDSKAGETQPNRNRQPPQSSQTPSDNNLFEMLQSYVPTEKVDPGIEAEIAKGASDVRVIVFYDLVLKGEVLSSIPSSVRIGSDFEGALPFLSLKVPADLDVVQEIAHVSGVKGVYLDRMLYPEWMRDERKMSNGVPESESPYEGTPPFLLNQTTELIGAQELWDMGFTGKNVTIAVTDTGINKYHPDFYFPDTGENKVIFEYVTVDEDYDGSPDVGPEDIIGHGTHVASTAAGTGRSGGADFFYDSTNGSYRTVYLEPGTEKGVAPDAYLMNIKICHDGYAYTEWMLEGYVQAVLHGADVISTSFGGHYEYPEWDFPFIYTVEWATQNGVVVVFAAGNEGPDFGTIASAGHSDSVITVGATTKLDRVAWWSSRGPSTPLAIFGANFLPYETTYLPWVVNATAAGALKTKPDVVAPGESISAAYAYYTQTEEWAVQEGAPPDGVMYITFGGTSMATPHVAGAAALLLQAFPGAVPASVKTAMIKGADDLGLDPNVQGAGRLNVTRAYDVMDDADSEPSTIAAPLEDIPAEGPEYGPYPYFTGTDVLVEDRISQDESFTRYINTLEADNASIYYASSELYNPAGTHSGFNNTVIDSPHPVYGNNYINTWVVEEPGATSLRLHFKMIRLADAGDIITVTNKWGGGAPPTPITGPTVQYNVLVTVTGDQAFIRLETNAAGQEWGFQIDGWDWYGVPNGRRSIYSTSISIPYTDPRPTISTLIESPHPYVDTVYTLPSPVQSDHPYANNFFKEWTIQQPGALAMYLHFSRIGIAAGDLLEVFDKGYNLVTFWSGVSGWTDVWTGLVIGDRAIIRLTTDETITEEGFIVDRYIYYSSYETTFTLNDGARARLHFNTINLEPGDTLSLSDTENNALTITWAMANEKHTNNIAGDGYDPGEWIYRDVDNNGLVSEGDVRLTEVTIFITIYPANSIVSAGPPADLDIGWPLIPFAANERHFESPVNGIYDPGEDIYRDSDNSRTVTVNDRRLTTVTIGATVYPANSLVAAGNLDVNRALSTFSLVDYWTFGPLSNTGTTFRGDGCKLRISITLYPDGDGASGWGFKIDNYEYVKYDQFIYEEGAGLILLHFDKISLTANDYIEIKANETTPIKYWRSPSGFVSTDFWLPIPQLGGGAGWNPGGSRTGDFLKIAIITNNDGTYGEGYVIDRYAVWYDSPSIRMLKNYDALLMLNPTSDGPTFRLVNGGFETGDFTGWESGGWGDHKVVNTQPGTGTYSALLGWRDAQIFANTPDWMYQTVKVPGGSQNALLSFQYRIHTWDYYPFNQFNVRIRNENGVNLATVISTGGPFLGGFVYQDLEWDHVVFDLSPWAGQTIQLYFEVFNGADTLAPTWVYVDDVSVSGQYIPNSALNDYVNTYKGNLLITGDWPDMIPKPDDTDPYTGLNYYTKDLGITWNDTVGGGGYTTNILTHEITRNVTTLYFGGPLTSLINGTGTTAVVYDPILPAVVAKGQTATGKVVAISDDDVLDDIYLVNPMFESDNLRLGLNIIAWFAGISTTIFDLKFTAEIHDLGLGVTYPVYIINGTSATIKMNIANFGNYTENTFYAWLQVWSSEGELTYNKTETLTPTGGLKPGATQTVTFTVPPANISSDLHADTVYISGLTSLWANFTSPFGDDWTPNNWWPYWLGMQPELTAINIIVKAPRTGVNPILSAIEPKSLDSYTSPFVAAFPGDWKPLNVTFVTSGKLVDGTMQISGNIADIADFYQYNSTTELFEPIGDTLDIVLKDMSWWQHTTTNELTSNPTSTSGAGWTDPTRAYTSNNQYAYSYTPNAQQTYRNYGFDTIWNYYYDAVITKVEVGIEADTWGDERIGLYVSWDGGTSWSDEQISDTLPPYDYNNVTWFDFTLATHWTLDKLDNTDFRVRVENEVVGDTERTRLDWLPVRVTYTSSVMLSLYGYEWSNLLFYPPHIIPSLNSTGHAFGYMEIKIPEDATPGTYTGSVTVYNGTTVVESMPINIEVKEPKAKLLYDDLGPYWMQLMAMMWWDYYLLDYKFLWNSYYDAWVKAAQWGFDIDSLLLTQHFMKLDLEKIFKEQPLPWRWEDIIASKFDETFSKYSTILEFNNKLLMRPWWWYNVWDESPEGAPWWDSWWPVYFRNLDSGLYGPGYAYYSLLDVYDLVLRAKGNLVMLADDQTQDGAYGDWEGYNNVLSWLTDGDIYVSYNWIFNWTITKDHMEDFPHWITHDVENFTMAGWSYQGYTGIMDYGGYFLDMPENGYTDVLTDIESPHPYPNNYVNEWNITVPGAESIWVHFETIDLEEDTGDRKGDWIKVYDGNHTLWDTYTGYYEDWWSWVPGNTTYIKMSTDTDLQSWGFKIDRYAYESKDGVTVLAMGTQEIEWFDDWEYRWKEGLEWGPIMAIDEHLTGLSPTTGLPYIGSKVFVMGEANQFENLFLEYQDWLTSDMYFDLTAGLGEAKTWTLDTLLHNILAYMSDNTPPTTTITYSSPSYTNGTLLYVGASTTFTLSATDAQTEVDSTYYKIDEEAWTTYTQPFNFSDRIDGNYTTSYYSTDAAGNEESESNLALILDKTPPNVTIDSISVNPGFTISSMTVSWSAVDNSSGINHFEVKVDEQSYVTTLANETSYTFDNMTDGSHTVFVRAVDNVDNVGAVDSEGNIVTEVSQDFAVQSYWPYVAGGIIVIVIIAGVAAYYLFIKRKKPPVT